MAWLRQALALVAAILLAVLVCGGILVVITLGSVFMTGLGAVSVVIFTAWMIYEWFTAPRR